MWSLIYCKKHVEVLKVFLALYFVAVSMFCSSAFAQSPKSPSITGISLNGGSFAELKRSLGNVFPSELSAIFSLPRIPGGAFGAAASYVAAEKSGTTAPRPPLTATDSVTPQSRKVVDNFITNALLSFIGIPLEPSIVKDIPPSYLSKLPYSGAPQTDFFSLLQSIQVGQRGAEMALDKPFSSSQAIYSADVQGIADGVGGFSTAAFRANTSVVGLPIINVANEQAAAPFASGASGQTLPQSVGMVQRMLRHFYLPLALLLLLPGALLTQTRTFVWNTMSSDPRPSDTSPFSGLVRAMVAVVLMASCQLIVSYSVDVGNALTQGVLNFVSIDSLQEWASQQANFSNEPNTQKLLDKELSETTMNSMSRAVQGSINVGLNAGMMMMASFQTVLVCYLLLMGPIACSFFAWPGNMGNLFRPVFSSWVNALVAVVSWRFIWAIIFLCMDTRIAWLKEIGDYNPSSPWEGITYSAFLTMLCLAPAAAFQFKPGDFVSTVLEKTHTTPPGQSNS